MSEKPKKQSKEEQVKQAYKDVLGREADASGLKHYVRETGIHGIDWVKKDLATSKEARSRGVDPTKFGAKKFDPASLAKKYQPYYEQWKASNGGVFTDQDALRLKWDGDAYSVDAYKQKLLGNIDDGNGVRINEAAVQALGADLSKHFTGTQGGQGFLFPRITMVDGVETEVKLKGDTFGKTKKYTNKDGTDTGYNVVGATGNLSTGVVGWAGEKTGIKAFEDPVGALRKAGVGRDVIGALGASRDIATLGVADIDENILFGQRGSNQIDPWSAKAIHVKEKDYSRGVQYGQMAAKTIAQVVLTATGAGAPAAMALEAGWQAARAAEAKQMRTDFSWGNAAVMTLSAGIAVGSDSVMAGAAIAGASSAGAQAIDGKSVDWGVVGEAAAIGGVSKMNLLGNVQGIDIATSAYQFNKAEDKSWAFAGIAASGMANAATRAANGEQLSWFDSSGSVLDTKWKGSFGSGGSREGWNPLGGKSWAVDVVGRRKTPAPQDNRVVMSPHRLGSNFEDGDWLAPPADVRESGLGQDLGGGGLRLWGLRRKNQVEE